jgi:hypothetical protein
MARAAAKKKRDVPPLYVLVGDGGRLDPAFQHDQERVMSFRKGTRLVVTIEPDGSRRGVRKWHAIIGKAVKNSLLPWVTASAADEAIRLALEMYEPKRANDGTWHRVTQSLNDLSDEELDEKIELMTALVYRISGVDPDDFKREMAGAGDERFQSDYDKPAADNQNAGQGGTESSSPPAPESGAATNSEEMVSSDPADSDVLTGAGRPHPESLDGATQLVEGESSDAGINPAPPPAGVAATIPAQEPRGEASADVDAPVDAPDASTQPTATPEASGALSNEDRAWLKLGARMMLACLPDADPEALRVLIVQCGEIRKLKPADASKETLERMESMRLHCRRVCDGQEKLDKRFIAERAMASPAEIEPKKIQTRSA